MDKNELKSVNGSTIVMYTNEDGVTNLDVRLELQDISTRFSKKANWMKPWYVQNLHTPRNMAVEKVFYRIKRFSLWQKWAQTHCRQYIGSFNIDDSRIKV